MWEILCRERDLRRKRPKKLKTRETKYVEINNIVYMELYLGAKMLNEKDLKTKYLRSKNREFTVL
jgi:alanyl-tRNA synthetase